MCVWTKKRGSLNAVVLMATPCPKSLHGKGEKWIARNILQGLDSNDVCNFFLLPKEKNVNCSQQLTGQTQLVK